MLDALLSHVRLFNEMKVDSFKDVIATSCSDSLQRINKADILEALAFKCGIETARLQAAAASIEGIQAKMSRDLLRPEQIDKDLISLGLQPEKAVFLKEFLIGRYSGPAEATDSLSSPATITAGQLIDMEWKFGVAAASSELDRLGSTFVQLKLKVSNPDGSIENLNMELSLSQFYNLMHQLEKAKASLDYITV
ncbi:COMM domain-containing protein 7-like [Watersipora subatra]|uniref:COMM domain-containing protein 7-like n=1 Tax=Watersipora subatra TaxID=2589382 RepID=UPI00355AF1F3